MTNEATFASIQTWLDSLKQNGEVDLIIMLVGNKVDLLEENGGVDERQVPREVAEGFAKRNRLLFIETSALTQRNVAAAFENLLQQINEMRSRMPKKLAKNPLILENESAFAETPASKGCC